MYMKVYPIFLILIILVVFSCKSKQQHNSKEYAAAKDSLVPAKVTVLADLHDTLQPKIIYLDKMPPPKVVAATKNAAPFKTAVGKSSFTNFTTDEGLVLDVITCSIMDKAGNLWFGTLDGGVSKYDGKSFTNFTTEQGLALNLVLCITEDRAGNIWFGTQRGGVSKYDGRSFTNFTTAQGLANNSVNSIIEDKAGNLWFATFGGGVSKLALSNNDKSDSKSLSSGQPGFTHLTTADGLLSNRVTSIIEDRTGILWFGMAEGLSKYDGKSFTNYPIVQGLAGKWILSITEDKTGNLWFCTPVGVSRYDPSASLRTGYPSFTRFTTAQGLPSKNFRKMIEDKAGNLWFATSGGVSKYDGKSLPAGQASFINITTEQGLVSNEISSITEDKAGNLWFSTLGDGVCKYDGNAFISFTADEGLVNNLIVSIAEDKNGNHWFGSLRNGVSKYDGKSFTNYTTTEGLLGNNVGCTTEDKAGNLWFGTDGGVSKYDGKFFTNFTITQSLTGDQVGSITEDKAGNLWFGTYRNGVIKYDGKLFTYFTTSQGLANNFVYSISEDKAGNFWFGTSEGLSKYDGKSITNFTTAQGLAHNTVRSITEDKAGNIWFGTREGLSVMRAGSVNQFINFKMKDGLPDNAISNVIQMPNGKMLVGSNSGITLFNVSEDFSTLTEIETFDSKTDYPVKNLNGWSNSVYLDSKGIIWAGTRSEKRGLVRFDYAALRKNTVPPTLVIQSIKVKDEPINWYNLQNKGDRRTKEDSATALLQDYLAYGKNLSTIESDSILQRFGNIRFEAITKVNPLPEKLVLPYEHNQVGFEFTAIETDRPQLVKYQYMLEGYDKTWSAITGKSFANFGNISEGSYTFKVKAMGANKVWTEPITYSFKVLPPWYRSWWAYTLYALLFASGLFLFIRWRTKALQKEKIVLEEKVTTRTAELNQSLENLKATQSQLIQSEKMASLGELTAGIAHEIQNPLNFVNNFSELNKELVDELQQELRAGKIDDAIDISNDIKANEEKINHHGKRADAIVKGMLQHSRSSTGQREPTDINALCDEYLRLAFHGLQAKDNYFHAGFKTEFDQSIGNISIVPQDIGRVLFNLINNAFYAVAEKSKSSDSSYQPAVIVSTNRKDNIIGITVSDNGNGIPETIKDKIFQPFFTTKPTGQGTGLGLSLSYDIVKAHGGEIKVHTKELEGTEFIIQLPLEKGA